MNRETLLVWKKFVEREYLWWILLSGLAVLGIILMRYLTPNGMGLVNDSVEYIGGARNFLAGKGYSRIGGDGNPIPITHFPPMFSSLLIAVSFFGLDVIRAAHLVNLLFFGANIVLTGMLVRRLTASKWLAFFSALIFMISDPILRVHSFVLSEPLFLFLVYCIYWFSMNYLERHHWYWLALAGLFTGMAFLDRYIGGTLFALVGLLLLLFVPSWKQKIKDIALYLLVGLPGPAVWLVRNYFVSGNPTNRPLSYHPLETLQWYDGVRNFWTWILPDYQSVLEPNMYYLGIALIIIVALFTAFCAYWIFDTWHLQRSGQVKTESKSGLFVQPDRMVAIVTSMYGVIYFVLLLVAMTFFDEATTFEHRMLLPFYTSFLILLCGLLAYLWRHPGWMMKAFVFLVCMGLFLSITEDSVDTIQELHSGGQGFASGRWRNSATVEALKHLPQETKIFTNKRTAVYLLADRGSYVIPWRFYPDNPEPDPSYVAGVENYRNQVLRKEAVVVIFDYEQAIRDQNEPVMDMTTGLPILGMFDDGAIFGELP